MEQKDQKRTLDTVNYARLPNSLRAYDDWLSQQLSKQIIRVTLDIIAKSKELKKPWYVFLWQWFARFACIKSING